MTRAIGNEFYNDYEYQRREQFEEECEQLRKKQMTKTQESIIIDWPKTLTSLDVAGILLKLARDKEEIVRVSDTYDAYNECIEAITLVKEFYQHEHSR